MPVWPRLFICSVHYVEAESSGVHQERTDRNVCMLTVLNSLSCSCQAPVVSDILVLVLWLWPVNLGHTTPHTHTALLRAQSVGLMFKCMDCDWTSCRVRTSRRLGSQPWLAPEGRRCLMTPSYSKSKRLLTSDVEIGVTVCQCCRYCACVAEMLSKSQVSYASGSKSRSLGG